MKIRRLSAMSAALIVLASAALVAPMTVLAASISVNTTADENGTGSACSLREAIMSANTASAVGGCDAGSSGPNVIDVPAGVYELDSSPGFGEIAVGTNPDADISIVGAGAGVTSIGYPNAGFCGGQSRIFNVGPLGVSGVQAQISDVTLIGGFTSSAGAGAAISGGGPGQSLKLSDAVLVRNCSLSNGGGIAWKTGGNLTLTRTTFDRNYTYQYDFGGALLFDTGVASTLTITDSTFSFNGGALAGGALYLNGAGNVYAIDGSTFTGNSTDNNGLGGAIHVQSGTLNLGTAAANVLVGNTAPDPAFGGLSVGTTAVANAANNWWGCNEGPGAGVGCDKAVTVTGELHFDPWLVLRNTANPSSIPLNHTSTLAGDFLHNSDGTVLPAAQVAALTGRTVTWNNAVNGSLSAQQTTIQSNGKATAVFTPSAQGAASADATVDNATATAVLTVDKGNPTIAITSDNPDPSVVGQTVTVQYSVTPTTPTAPTGNVTVSDGVDSCTATVAAGQCTLTLTTVGNRSLTASYAGDANFNGSTSAPAAHTVNAIPDATSPSVSNVTTILREGGHIGSVSVVVSWSASDDVTPTDSLVFQIQRRRFRMHGPTAWQDVATVTGQTSLYQVPLWHRYQYRVRATDTAGHTGDWAEAFPVTFIRRDERQFTRDASWTITPVAGAMRGSVARSSTPGGTAFLTFTGNGVAVVATTGPGQGTLMACIDQGTASQSCRTVDLGAMPAGLKQLPVVFSLPWATHTLQVTVISGNVDLDGAIFSR